MRKLDTLIKTSTDSQFNQLAEQANTHLHLRQFWQAVAPKLLSQHSYAAGLTNGQLTIYADNASVAAKIKLTSANLLSQLQILQKTSPFYGGYKVTAIIVKVQVKSQAKRAAKTPRMLSKHAANQLESLANQLGDSTLAQKLKQLASKQ